MQGDWFTVREKPLSGLRGRTLVLGCWVYGAAVLMKAERARRLFIRADQADLHGIVGEHAP